MMPIIESLYLPPRSFQQTDFATIYSEKIRKVTGVIQHRKRIELSDGDFLDLDFSFSNQKTNRCIILLRRLEGNA